MLASLLDNVVADNSLSYSGLGGSNLQFVTYLRQAAEKYGFCVYLANMERSITYEEDDCDYEMFEKEIDQSEAVSTLIRVVELDGFEIAKAMNFEDDMLIQEEAFNEVEPDDDYDGTVFTCARYEDSVRYCSRLTLSSGRTFHAEAISNQILSDTDIPMCCTRLW